MSVDFSQFFNGPIRDSLIAQVSGYLDISRPQATIAYDKAVALVIGAMAQRAGKPEGAQALAAHIQDSQTQTSLTSSALSPTVLTNDQFAQIVTLGESEQAIILGQQQEAVTAHLEVATGLDTKAVGSLLSIVVPFVLSFLKNNITTENEPAQSLPVLFAAQAPHVATQLDAPALAALGEDSLEGLFGPDALAAAPGNAAASSQNGKHESTQGATANEKPANGWFKWVLTLAVVLAGAAWVKSCTQSDTTKTDNAKPADQQQSATDAPASDAATAPAATPATPQAVAPAATTGADSKAAEPGDATAPSANFPEPDSTQSAGVAAAPAAEGAQKDSAKPESAQAEGADTPATAVAPAETTESKQNTETVPPTGDKPDGEQSASAGGQADAPATESTQPETSATADPEPVANTAKTESTNDANDGQTAGPTYGQASDTMEPEAQSDVTAAAASTDTASTDTANSVADKATEQTAPSSAEQANTDNTKPAATVEDSKQADQMPAPAAEGVAAATTAPEASSTTAEQAGSSNATTDKAATANTAADIAASGKTTTFAEPAPLADKPDTPPAASTPEPAGAAGKTTTFAESDSSGSRPEPAQPQDTKADQPADTQSGTAPAGDEVAPSATNTEPSGKTTTFGATGSDDSASAGATQADSTATTADNAGQSPATAAATGSVQAGAAAQVKLERDGDALRIRGTVPDESARNRILNAAKFVDGHSKIEDELKVDSQVAASRFDDYSGLLSLLRGYHDVNVSLQQDALTLTGQVSSSEEKEALTTKVQNLVGADIQVDNQAEVAATARTAAPNAAAATGVPPLVQFASGSAQVDSRFHGDLDRYAQQLKESGKSVQLVGFADESGSEPGNEALSKRRAESIKAYLILRGVQAQRIQTEGQGTQAPVADNTTEAGRAKNRRVQIHELQ